MVPSLSVPVPVRLAELVGNVKILSVPALANGDLLLLAAIPLAISTLLPHAGIVTELL